MQDAPDATVDRSTMLQIFRGAFYKAFTRPNIKSGFRKTGIYPFDPDIVLKNPDNFIQKEGAAPDHSSETPGETAAVSNAEEDEALGSGSEGAGETGSAEGEVEDVAALLLQMRSEYPEISLAEEEEREAGSGTEAVAERGLEVGSITPQQIEEEGEALAVPAEHSSRASVSNARSETRQPRLTVPGLDPVPDQILRLPPPPPPKPRRVTENAVVNASRLLTDPVLLALKEQLAQEKAEKQRQSEERRRLAEERKRQKEQEEEEKKEKARKRKEEQAAREEQQKREAEEKARRKAEEKNAREEQKRREEEEKARREEEKRRAREEKKQQEEVEKARRAEERRVAQEAKKKRDEEERARKREEDRIAKEEKLKKKEAERLEREQKRRREAEEREGAGGTGKPAAKRKRSQRSRGRTGANLGGLSFDEAMSSEQSESDDAGRPWGPLQQPCWPHAFPADQQPEWGRALRQLGAGPLWLPPEPTGATLSQEEETGSQPEAGVDGTWLSDLIQNSLMQAGKVQESEADSEETK